MNDTIKQNMNNKIILWNINDKVISKSQPRKICITVTIQQPQLKVSETFWQNFRNYSTDE